MPTSKKRVLYTSEYDDQFYWDRVQRSLGWLGDTLQEQQDNQRKLRDATVGIAGCGGIGGSMAERLVRLGVRNLKIADLDDFEATNINRQLGAEIANVGRNKAEVVGEYVHNLTRDSNIEVFPEGITEDNAKEFVSGCDYILDEIEPYVFQARYHLHRAFRASERCQFAMTIYVFGNRSFLWKWTHDSMPLEEYLGIPEDVTLTKDQVRQLISRLIPESPGYPGQEMQDNWLIDNATCPITAGAPPMAQGLLTERFALEVTGINESSGTTQIPTSPGYAMIDSRSWEMRTVEGKWW